MAVSFEGKIFKVKRKEQLGIFLLDGSGSMDEVGEYNLSLAENVNNTFKEFMTLFQTSSIEHEFQIAVINFDYEATVRVPVTALTDFDVYADYNPRDKSKDNPGTNIGLGLLKAQEIIDEYFAQPNPDGYPRSVVIAILSDGMCQHPERTLSMANELKSNPDITISCGLFIKKGDISQAETKETQNFLRQIKSETGAYGLILNCEQLRKFFNASMSASK